MAVTKNGNGNLQNLESQNVQVQMIAADVQVQMIEKEKEILTAASPIIFSRHFLNKIVSPLKSS